MKHNQISLHEIDSSWTLFLDRDGVINRKIDDDYVRHPEDFIFLEQVPESIAALGKVFGKIVITTNQRGIGRGLFSEANLHDIHRSMLQKVEKMGGRIDGIFYCPHLADDPDCDCRKPKPGMAYQAQQRFPEINFQKSVMVGDSMSDIGFGNDLGMHTVHITLADVTQANEKWSSLFAWTSHLLGADFMEN